MFAGVGLAVDDLAGGILGGEEGSAAGPRQQREEVGAAGFEGVRRDGVDGEPGVDAVFAPDGIPVLGRVDAGVAEDLGALAHALLELDGEGEEGGLGEFELRRGRGG